MWNLCTKCFGKQKKSLDFHNYSVLRLPGFQRLKDKTTKGRRFTRQLLRLRPRCREGRQTYRHGTPTEYRVPRGISVVPTHRGTENVRGKRTVIVRNRDAYPNRCLYVAFCFWPGTGIYEPHSSHPCEYNMVNHVFICILQFNIISYIPI